MDASMTPGWRWRVVDDEPVVEHLHEPDNWLQAVLLTNPLNSERQATCACGAQVTLGREGDGWTLRPK